MLQSLKDRFSRIFLDTDVERRRSAIRHVGSKTPLPAGGGVWGRGYFFIIWPPNGAFSAVFKLDLMETRRTQLQKEEAIASYWLGLWKVVWVGDGTLDRALLRSYRLSDHFATCNGFAAICNAVFDWGFRSPNLPFSWAGQRPVSNTMLLGTTRVSL